MASSSQIEMEGMRSFFVRALRAVEYTTSEATALGKQNERELESLRSEIDRLRKAGGKENQIGGENMLALDAKVETLFSSQRALSQKIESLSANVDGSTKHLQGGCKAESEIEEKLSSLHDDLYARFRDLERQAFSHDSDMAGNIERLALQEDVLQATVTEIRQDLLDLRTFEEKRALSTEERMVARRQEAVAMHAEVKGEVGALFKGEMQLGQRVREVEKTLSAKVQSLSEAVSTRLNAMDEILRGNAHSMAHSVSAAQASIFPQMEAMFEARIRESQLAVERKMAVMEAAMAEKLATIDSSTATVLSRELEIAEERLVVKVRESEFRAAERERKLRAELEATQKGMPVIAHETQRDDVKLQQMAASLQEQMKDLADAVVSNADATRQRLVEVEDAARQAARLAESAHAAARRKPDIDFDAGALELMAGDVEKLAMQDDVLQATVAELRQDVLDMRHAQKEKITVAADDRTLLTEIRHELELHQRSADERWASLEMRLRSHADEYAAKHKEFQSSIEELSQGMVQRVESVERKLDAGKALSDARQVCDSNEGRVDELIQKLNIQVLELYSLVESGSKSVRNVVKAAEEGAAASQRLDAFQTQVQGWERTVNADILALKGALAKGEGGRMYAGGPTSSLQLQRSVGTVQSTTHARLEEGSCASELEEEVGRLGRQDLVLGEMISEMRQDLTNLQNLDQDRSVQMTSRLQEIHTMHVTAHKEVKAEVEAMFKGEVKFGQYLREMEGRFEERMEQVGRSLALESSLAAQDTSSLEEIGAELVTLRLQDDVLQQTVSGMRQDWLEMKQNDDLRLPLKSGALVALHELESKLRNVQATVSGRIGMIEQNCAAISAELLGIEERLDGITDLALSEVREQVSEIMPIERGHASSIQCVRKDYENALEISTADMRREIDGVRNDVSQLRNTVTTISAVTMSEQGSRATVPQLLIADMTDLVDGGAGDMAVPGAKSSHVQCQHGALDVNSHRESASATQEDEEDEVALGQSLFTQGISSSQKSGVGWDASTVLRFLRAELRAELEHRAGQHAEEVDARMQVLEAAVERLSLASFPGEQAQQAQNGAFSQQERIVHAELKDHLTRSDIEKLIEEKILSVESDSVRVSNGVCDTSAAEQGCMTISDVRNIVEEMIMIQVGGSARADPTSGATGIDFERSATREESGEHAEQRDFGRNAMRSDITAAQAATGEKLRTALREQDEVKRTSGSRQIRLDRSSTVPGKVKAIEMSGRPDPELMDKSLTSPRLSPRREMLGRSFKGMMHQSQGFTAALETDRSQGLAEKVHSLEARADLFEQELAASKATTEAVLRDVASANDVKASMEALNAMVSERADLSGRGDFHGVAVETGGVDCKEVEGRIDRLELAVMDLQEQLEGGERGEGMTERLQQAEEASKRVAEGTERLTATIQGIIVNQHYLQRTALTPSSFQSPAFDPTESKASPVSMLSHVAMASEHVLAARVDALERTLYDRDFSIEDHLRKKDESPMKSKDKGSAGQEQGHATAQTVCAREEVARFSAKLEELSVACECALSDADVAKSQSSHVEASLERHADAAVGTERLLGQVSTRVGVFEGAQREIVEARVAALERAMSEQKRLGKMADVGSSRNIFGGSMRDVNTAISRDRGLRTLERELAECIQVADDLQKRVMVLEEAANSDRKSDSAASGSAQQSDVAAMVALQKRVLELEEALGPGKEIADLGSRDEMAGMRAELDGLKKQVVQACSAGGELRQWQEENYVLRQKGNEVSCPQPDDDAMTRMREDLDVLRETVQDVKLLEEDHKKLQEEVDVLWKVVGESKPTEAFDAELVRLSDEAIALRSMVLEAGEVMRQQALDEGILSAAINVQLQNLSGEVVSLRDSVADGRMVNEAMQQQVRGGSQHADTIDAELRRLSGDVILMRGLISEAVDKNQETVRKIADEDERTAAIEAGVKRLFDEMSLLQATMTAGEGRDGAARRDHSVAVPTVPEEGAGIANVHNSVALLRGEIFARIEALEGRYFAGMESSDVVLQGEITAQREATDCKADRQGVDAMLKDLEDQMMKHVSDCMKDVEGRLDRSGLVTMLNDQKSELLLQVSDCTKDVEDRLDGLESVRTLNDLKSELMLSISEGLKDIEERYDRSGLVTMLGDMKDELAQQITELEEVVLTYSASAGSVAGEVEVMGGRAVDLCSKVAVLEERLSEMAGTNYDNLLFKVASLEEEVRDALGTRVADMQSEGNAVEERTPETLENQSDLESKDAVLEEPQQRSAVECVGMDILERRLGEMSRHLSERISLTLDSAQHHCDNKITALDETMRSLVRESDSRPAEKDGLAKQRQTESVDVLERRVRALEIASLPLEEGQPLTIGAERVMDARIEALRGDVSSLGERLEKQIRDVEGRSAEAVATFRLQLQNLAGTVATDADKGTRCFMEIQRAQEDLYALNVRVKDAEGAQREADLLKQRIQELAEGIACEAEWVRIKMQEQTEGTMRESESLRKKVKELFAEVDSNAKAHLHMEEALTLRLEEMSNRVDSNLEMNERSEDLSQSFQKQVLDLASVMSADADVATKRSRQITAALESNAELQRKLESESETIKGELRKLVKNMAVDAGQSHGRMQELASAVERMSAGMRPQASSQGDVTKLGDELRSIQRALSGLQGRVSSLESLCEETPARLHVTILGADGLPKIDMTEMPDPYCTVTVGEEAVKTRIARKTTSPLWGDKGEIVLQDSESSMLVRVYDWELKHAHRLEGSAEVHLDDIRAAHGEEMCIPLIKANGDVLKSRNGKPATVRLKVVCREGGGIPNMERRICECERGVHGIVAGSGGVADLLMTRIAKCEDGLEHALEGATRGARTAEVPEALEVRISRCEADVKRALQGASDGTMGSDASLECLQTRMALCEAEMRSVLERMPIADLGARLAAIEERCIEIDKAGLKGRSAQEESGAETESTVANVQSQVRDLAQAMASAIANHKGSIEMMGESIREMHSTHEGRFQVLLGNIEHLAESLQRLKETNVQQEVGFGSLVEGVERVRVNAQRLEEASQNHQEILGCLSESVERVQKNVQSLDYASEEQAGGLTSLADSMTLVQENVHGLTKTSERHDGRIVDISASVQRVSESLQGVQNASAADDKGVVEMAEGVERLRDSVQSLERFSGSTRASASTVGGGTADDIAKLESDLRALIREHEERIMLARVALESELQQLVDTSAEEAGKATRALEQRIDALEGDMQRGGLDDVIEAVEAAKALKARVVALEVKERGGCMDEVFERLSSVEKEVKDCSRGLDEAVTLHAAGIERCRSSLIAEGVRSGKLEERMRSMEEMLETEIEKRETGLDHVREEVHTLEGRFDTETQKRVARLDSIGERVGVLEGGLETDTRKRETELNSIGKRLDGLAERLEAEALKYDGWVGERLDGLDRRLLELEGGLASEMSRSKADQDKLCRLEGEEETRQSEWNARLRFLQERVEVMGTPKRSDLQPQPEEQRAQTPRTPLQFV